MNDKDFERIEELFNSITWHDSKLLGVCISYAGRQEGFFDLELKIDVVASKNDAKTVMKKIVFEQCRVVNLDLDLLGVAICSGHIGSAACYKDAILTEKQLRNGRERFDFPESSLPFADIFACHIEMIHPGGELLIFARNFSISP